MTGKAAVLMYYGPSNKYSINALVAVLDLLDEIDVYLVEDYVKTPFLARSLLNKYNIVIVGMSFNTLMLTDKKFLDTIFLLNKNKPCNIITIAGGPHPSGDPIGSIESLKFDYVIIGEGERSLPKLVEELMEKGDPYNVEGVFAKDESGKFVFKKRPRIINLDEYHPFPFWRYLFGAIEITRGCPIGCKYCQVTYMHGPILRHRGIENILYYLDIMGKHELKDWRFITPNSLCYGMKSYEREPRLEIIEELLDKMSLLSRKYNGRIFYGTFPSEVRPEHLTYEAAKVLRKYVSNKNIIIGAQSGSNRVLKYIGRKHTIEDVYEAVEAAIKNGFTPDVDYIIGLPGEQKEDLEETLASIKKITSMGGRVHLHVFLPLPGTPFSMAPPGKIPDWFKKEVYKLLGKGKLYGQWKMQEELAEKIHELRIKGIIMPHKKYILQAK